MSWREILIPNSSDFNDKSKNEPFSHYCHKDYEIKNKDFEMIKLRKRLEKLENILNPPKPKKSIIVIQHVGETKQQALSKAGIADPEAYKIWYVVAVRPKEHKE